LPWMSVINHGHDTVVNQQETIYFDIVYTDMSASEIKDTLNGLCDTCHKNHDIKFENISQIN
jgi:hypothetical protein